MRYFYSPKYEYCMGYSPKCGCTTWNYIFLKLHENEISKDLLDLGIGPQVPDGIRNPISIVVTRNPYTRIVSMFTGKVLKLQFQDKLKNFPMKERSFKGFVDALVKLKQENRLEKFDWHFWPQSNNLYKMGTIKIVKLEQFETNLIEAYKSHHNLVQLVPRVKKILDEGFQWGKEPSKTTKLNSSNPLHPSTEYVFNKVYRLSPSKEPIPDYKYFYNKELLETVYELYREDFENFGYEKYKI
tara:strand:- start:26460 stop:27185 length:726 start_codon:yes stop_codon:yes gene_type:complete